MAKRYAIWDKTSDVYTPSGQVFTAEQWIEKYSWINIPGVVPIVSAGPINGGVSMILGDLKKIAESQGATFDESLEGQALLDAIEQFEDEKSAAMSEASREPSAQDRIAAALEYQNIMAE